jgi:hypothetical protein
MKLFLFGFCFFLLGFCCQMNAQKLLQIEDPKEVKTIRYYEGEKITFKTEYFGKEWQTKKIKSIMVDEAVIVFEDGFISISEITHVRHGLPIRKIVGKALMTFGIGWLTYGGIALMLNLPNVVPKDLLTGGIALVSGYFIQLFSRKIYIVGKNARLRLLDITFPSFQPSTS